MPNLWHQATKMPDIEVNMPDVMPKVIDLTSLGPKKVYNITLPQVRHQLSLYRANMQAAWWQWLLATPAQVSDVTSSHDYQPVWGVNCSGNTVVGLCDTRRCGTLLKVANHRRQPY